MNEELEVLDTQEEAQEGETPKVEALTPEEIAELKKRAEVSSQNYERAKKAEAEKKELQKQLEAFNTDSFVSDDETATKVQKLEEKLRAIEERTVLDALKQRYPVLNDKLAEFDEYRAEYPPEKLEVVAKLFLAEKDLLDETPKRKGLEKAGGGKRTPPQAPHDSDDIKRLRENNYREYLKQLRAGKINIS